MSPEKFSKGYVVDGEAWCGGFSGCEEGRCAEASGRLAERKIVGYDAMRLSKKKVLLVVEVNEGGVEKEL